MEEAIRHRSGQGVMCLHECARMSVLGVVRVCVCAGAFGLLCRDELWNAHLLLAAAAQAGETDVHTNLPRLI